VTEDELIDGVTGALTAGGWYWTHVRRSDRALVMGSPGVPDIIAVHPARGLTMVLECKSAGGRFRFGQWDWINAFRAVGIDARTVTPDGYDALIVELVGDRGTVQKRKGGKRAG
jgi:hypothetical protein